MLYVHLKLSFIPNKCIVRKTMEVIDIRPVLLPGKIQHLYHLLHFSKTGINIKEFNQSSDCALSNILPANPLRNIS